MAGAHDSLAPLGDRCVPCTRASGRAQSAALGHCSSTRRPRMAWRGRNRMHASHLSLSSMAHGPPSESESAACFVRSPASYGEFTMPSTGGTRTPDSGRGRHSQRETAFPMSPRILKASGHSEGLPWLPNGTAFLNTAGAVPHSEGPPYCEGCPRIRNAVPHLGAREPGGTETRAQ